MTLTLGWDQKQKCSGGHTANITDSKKVFLLARWLPAYLGKQHFWTKGKHFSQYFFWFESSDFRCNEWDGSVDRCFSSTFPSMNFDQMSGSHVIEFTHLLSTGLEIAWTKGCAVEKEMKASTILDIIDWSGLSPRQKKWWWSNCSQDNPRVFFNKIYEDRTW